jgi:phosphohistidine phosphatase SixA
MLIYLVRHARAFERDAAAWPDDSKRPLTHSGRERFRRLARHLGRVAPPVDLLESSRFTRAWQTAQILHAAAGWPEPVRHEGLEEEGDDRVESLARTLQLMRGIRSVAWVGHEPQLGRLASQLLCGRPDGVRVTFRKGAVARLALPEGGDGVLDWLLTPRLIRRTAS